MEQQLANTPTAPQQGGANTPQQQPSQQSGGPTPQQGSVKPIFRDWAAI